MKEMYVTVTGFGNYRGSSPFKIGNLIRCEKEPDNRHDSEAIRCTVPTVGTVGYIANSVHTVVNGTMSAGRVYDKVDKKFYIRVLFTTNCHVICRVEDGEPNDLKLELLSQLDEAWVEDVIPEKHCASDFEIVFNVGTDEDYDADDDDDDDDDLAEDDDV